MLLILAVWIVDAALWINENRFSIDYMPVRMMSWLGVVPKPDLVEIEPGTVRIGSETGNPDEQSVRELTIAKGFRIGRHEVTFYQYDFYAAALGKPLPQDSGFGRGSRAVIYVNWHDATAYTEWLSDQIGESCRLPGGDEWEYAARADGSGEYGLGQGGVEITRDNLGDYAWYSANAEGQTQPVGTKKPNAWGLYDMLGNVWEWSRDFYDDDKDSYVLRGGSGSDNPDLLRAALRRGSLPVPRYGLVGFRVVCVPHS